MLLSAKWPAGGTVSIMVSAMPSPMSQSAGQLRRRRPAGHRALDQVEALVEAVAAVEHVVVLGFRRRQHGIAGLDHIAAAHLERVDAELLGQLVDRGFDRDSVCGRP